MATSLIHAPLDVVRVIKSNAKVSTASIEQHVSTFATSRAQVHVDNSAPMVMALLVAVVFLLMMVPITNS